MNAWNAVTVGVENLDAAMSLWVGAFGFDVAAERAGPDSAAARLWDLRASDIRRQVLLRTGDAHTGMLHLVEFTAPSSPVRAGAATFDLCPKNLDIYTSDLPARVETLRSAGYGFRNDDYSEITTPQGVTFREIHMPVHDCINVVLLELLGKDLPFSPLGFAGVGPLVTIVPNADQEAGFYHEAIGLEHLSQARLDGPDIENMIGLPPGAALDVRILGDAQESLGQVEIIEYEGVRGRDLFPLARPTATGILKLTYVLDDLTAVADRLRRRGTTAIRHAQGESLIAAGAVLSVHTPAGFRIDFHERG